MTLTPFALNDKVKVYYSSFGFFKATPGGLFMNAKVLATDIGSRSEYYVSFIKDDKYNETFLIQYTGLGGPSVFASVKRSYPVLDYINQYHNTYCSWVCREEMELAEEVKTGPVFCKKCNEINEYLDKGNQADGSHICYSCRLI